MPYGGHAFQVLGFLVWGALMLVVIAIAVVVVILLARFLWFGTKAAKLYLATHEPSVPAPSHETAETTPDATAPVTPDASGPVPSDAPTTTPTTAPTAVIPETPVAPVIPPKIRKPKA